jgi:phage terminase Nu1 subunit (DNA packaging protein)
MPDLSVEAAARHLFISINRLRQLQREGVLPRATSGDWDLDTIRRRYIENLRAVKGNHLPPGAAGAAERLDLDRERARLAREQADKVALENARLRGKLVDVDEIKLALAVQDGIIKDRLLMIPQAVADRAVSAAPDGPAAVARVLETAVRHALEALASTVAVSSVAR